MATFLTPISPVLGGNETVSSVTLTNSVNPGQLWGDTAGNQYVYVYNTGVQQISQGQVGVLSAASGYSVTVSSTASLDLALGIARNATITTGAYGWLMYRGFSGFSADANVSSVTGGALALGTGGNIVGLTAAVGSFVTSPIIGKSILSVASGAVTATNAAFFNFM